MCVEELVGENDAVSGEFERFPDADGSDCTEGMLHPCKHAAAGLGADLHKRVRAGVTFAEQSHARRGDQFAEHGTERGRGVEIGVAPPPDARPVAAVVARGRVIEREFHEAREGERPVRARGGAESGEELR